MGLLLLEVVGCYYRAHEQSPIQSRESQDGNSRRAGTSPPNHEVGPFREGGGEDPQESQAEGHYTRGSGTHRSPGGGASRKATVPRGAGGEQRGRETVGADRRRGCPHQATRPDAQGQEEVPRAAGQNGGGSSEAVARPRVSEENAGGQSQASPPSEGYLDREGATSDPRREGHPLREAQEHQGGRSASVRCSSPFAEDRYRSRRVLLAQLSSVWPCGGQPEEATAGCREYPPGRSGRLDCGSDMGARFQGGSCGGQAVPALVSEECGFPGRGEIKTVDKRKTTYLTRRGWTILRVREHEIKADVGGCLAKVRGAIKNAQQQGAT